MHRKSEEYKDWARAVRRRDKNRCVICGSRRRTHVHHLNGWEWCYEERFEPSNGVVLCRTHHDQFHDQYGRGYNTRDQFVQYLTYYEKDLWEIIE